MRMTLFCDASFCSETNAAGWGAWAKRDEWQMGKSFGGQFKSQPNDSGIAELFAIANALCVSEKNGWLEDARLVLIQSDSANALSVARLSLGAALNAMKGAKSPPIWGVRAKRGQQSDGAKVLYELRYRWPKIAWQIRHVKGHSAGEGRNWVNRACDKIAKRHMRAAREAGVAA